MLAKGENSGVPLTVQQIDAILQFDTCTVANAIEAFRVRLRNQGFGQPGLKCFTGGRFPRLVGYAATFRTKSADPPTQGGYFLDRTDWWEAMGGVPMPRIAVIEDLDEHPGSASSAGEVHAAILKAFGYAGVITNGAVRDLPAVSEMNFPMFARFAAVSHSYMHLVDYGGTVDIFGLKIQQEDLLFADCHGVLSIPREIAAELPEACRRLRAGDQRIIALCQSPGFSREKLLEAIRSAEKDKSALD
jgi:4-hydroxy-4-methyl-2-oxoglutarate aldolase